MATQTGGFFPLKYDTSILAAIRVAKNTTPTGVNQPIPVNKYYVQLIMDALQDETFNSNYDSFRTLVYSKFNIDTTTFAVDNETDFENIPLSTFLNISDDMYAPRFASSSWTFDKIFKFSRLAKYVFSQVKLGSSVAESVGTVLTSQGSPTPPLYVVPRLVAVSTEDFLVLANTLTGGTYNYGSAPASVLATVFAEDNSAHTLSGITPGTDVDYYKACIVESVYLHLGIDITGTSYSWIKFDSDFVTANTFRVIFETNEEDSKLQTTLQIAQVIRFNAFLVAEAVQASVVYLWQ